MRDWYGPLLVNNALLVSSTLLGVYGVLSPGGSLSAAAVSALGLVSLLRRGVARAALAPALGGLTVYYVDPLLGSAALLAAALLIAPVALSRAPGAKLLYVADALESKRLAAPLIPSAYLLAYSAAREHALAALMSAYITLVVLARAPEALLEPRRVDEIEIPFFSMLSASYSLFSKGSVILALGSVGREAGALFKSLFKLVYLRWRRDTEYLGLDPLEAFKNSSRGSDLLEGLAKEYSVVVSSGGDERSFLFEKSEAVLEELRDSWDWRVRSLTSLSEVLFIISVLSPLMATLSSLVSIDPWLVVNASLYSSITACLASALVSGFLKPPLSWGFSVGRELLLGLALALAAGLALRAYQAPAEVVIPGLALSFVLPLSTKSLVYSLRARREERELGLVLKELVELARGEPPGLHLLNKLEPRGPLSLRLRESVRALEKGGRVADVVGEGLATKHTSLTVYLMLKLLELGGGLDAINQLSKFYSMVSSILRRASRELLAPVALAVIAAPLGVLSLNIMGFITGSLNGLAPLFGLTPGAVSPGELRLYLSAMLTVYSVTLPRILTGSFKSLHYSLPPLASLTTSMIVF